MCPRVASRKVGVGHVVRVEDRDERRVGQREGVVDVARLRAGVLVAADVAHAVAGGQVAHGVVVAVVEHPDPHLRAAQARGGRHGQVDDVHRLLVDGHEHVHGHPLARRLRLPHPLVRARPPEAERLGEVEELGRDQDAVEDRVADAVRVEQPAEVPDGQRQPEEGHDAHPRAHADVGRHRLPRDLPQADVPGAAAHRNSQTRVCGFSKRRQEPAGWKSSCPTTLFVRSKKQLVVLERGEHEDRASLAAPGLAAAQRPLRSSGA